MLINRLSCHLSDAGKGSVEGSRVDKETKNKVVKPWSLPTVRYYLKSDAFFFFVQDLILMIHSEILV